MSTGLFGDCPAWYDPGCLVESAGSVIGQGVTNALEPVWIALAVIGIIVLLILLLVGYAPGLRGVFKFTL